jgi:Calcineurin-like phosphoesterase
MKKFLSMYMLSLSIISITHSQLQKTDTYECSSTLDRKSTSSPYTLSRWASKIQSMKQYPVEYSTLPARAEYQKNILTPQEFLRALKQCVETIKNTTQTNAHWLDKCSLSNSNSDIFTINRPLDFKDISKNFIFKPYAQRLLVKPNSKVILFGDFHGSAHSFVRDLLKLRDLGLLDNNFKLVHPDSYILLLGDYTDRGLYGAECLYTLFRLKIANPSHVIIIRGNHEDYTILKQFQEHYKNKIPKDSLPNFLTELQLKFGFTDREQITIARFYDILPVVCYLGCQNTVHTHFIQCCHGGLELGYNPYMLINAPDCVAYELIQQTYRKTYFTTKLNRNIQNLIKTNLDLDTLCTEIQDIVFPSPLFKHPNNNKVSCLGFMWNYFYINPQTQLGVHKKNPSAWIYGQELTNTLLSWADSGKASLNGIIRAHQHTNETGGLFLNHICCNKGLFDLWQNNRVFTLISAPASKLEDTGEQCFTYDSFAILKPQILFEKWRLTHFYQDIAFEDKKWHCKTYTFKEPLNSRKILPITPRQTLKRSVALQ